VSILVCERLLTLCGETHLAGIPCALIRCAGCALRCTFCDTTYAQASEGEAFSVEQLEEWVESTGLRLVLLTGGEPLLQPEVPELAARLGERGRMVLVETSGAYDIRVLGPPTLRSLDIKCPGSGEASRMRWENLEALRPGDAVKLVLTGWEDYEYARQVIRRHNLGPPIEVLLSPAAPHLDAEELARWMLEDRLAEARLNLQVHRLLWPEVEGYRKKS